MKKILLGACALIAVPVIAQTAPAVMNSPTPATTVPHRMKADRIQSRAEVIQRTQRLFTMLDVNHDGVLDQAEIAAVGTHGMGDAGQESATEKAPLDRGAMFDRIDTNRDGSISRDEYAKAPTARVERQMVMRGDRTEAGPKGKRMGGKHGGMGRMLAMADTDRDGRITLQEATESALARFDRMDANRDGQVTPEERMAARAAMREQRTQ